MAKIKTKKELTKVDKLYIEMATEKLIERTGEVTEQDLEGFAGDCCVSTEIVKNHINIIITKQKPVEVETIPADPMAETIRTMLGPKEGMTIMSEAASSVIQDRKGNFKLNNNRYERNVYRGNKPTVRKT